MTERQRLKVLFGNGGNNDVILGVLAQVVEVNDGLTGQELLTYVALHLFVYGNAVDSHNYDKQAPMSFRCVRSNFNCLPASLSLKVCTLHPEKIY